MVSFEAGGDGRHRFAAPSSFVFADVLVLAAGTLGSTQILLNSRLVAWPSPRLGDRFTGNGDVLAFAYGVEGAPPTVQGIGAGRRPVTADNEVGPCITGMIDLTGTPTPGKGVLSRRAPSRRPPRFMPAAFAVAADIDDGGSPLSFARRLARRVVATGARRRPTGGPAERSLTYLVMSDDVGDGRLCLDGDEVKVDWPPSATCHLRPQRRCAAAGQRGRRRRARHQPLWSPMLRESLVTVHPLGGCAMADDGAHGVVDHRGRVFTGAGDEVYEDLLVTDGAIVPGPWRSTPCSPSRPSASGRAALLVAEKGGTSTAAPRPRSRPRERRPARRALHRAHGRVGRHGDRRRPRQGAARGEADGTRIEFVLTIDIDDLPSMLDDRAHAGPAERHGDGPAVSPRRMRVVDGSFRLAQEDPTHVDTWHMTYAMRLVADDGHHYDFAGHKVLHDRFGLDLWSDTTTLYVTISDDEGRPVAAGIMRIAPGDFARQLIDHAGHGRRRPARAGALAGPLRPPLRALARPGVRQPRRRRQRPPGPRRRSPSPAPAGGGYACPHPSPAGATATGAGTRAARTAPWATTPGCASSATRAGAAGPCCWPRASACRPRRSCSTR